jgi:hypothetical protein
MEIINHYSVIIGASFIFGLTTFVLLRDGFKRSDGIILFGVMIALVVVWILLRPQSGIDDGLVQFESQLGQGRAVLLELQSQY